MSEIPWWSPEGLELDGEVIGPWKLDEDGDWVRRSAGGSWVATATTDGFPAYWFLRDADDYKSAPTIEAAKKAADRALLARVFRSYGLHNAPLGSYGPAVLFKIGDRTWNAPQVREILEGAAVSGTRCNHTWVPVCGGMRCAKCNTDDILEGAAGANPATDGETPTCGAPTVGTSGANPELSITDAQLADLVTGLPLDGWVIGAPKEDGWRMRLEFFGASDRELLRASLEEARARPGGLRVSGRYLIWERTGVTSRLARKLDLVRAALPDFDWVGFPGYEPEPADRRDESFIDRAMRSLREIGFVRPTYKGLLLDELKRTLAEDEPEERFDPGDRVVFTMENGEVLRGEYVRRDVCACDPQCHVVREDVSGELWHWGGESIRHEPPPEPSAAEQGSGSFPAALEAERCVCGDQHAEEDCPTVAAWAECAGRPSLPMLWAKLHPPEVTAIVQAAGDDQDPKLPLAIASRIAGHLEQIQDTPAHHRLTRARSLRPSAAPRRILTRAAWRFRHVVREAWGSDDE